MKYTLKNQAKRVGIALAAVAAFSALGIGTAQAASFASATVSLDRLGNLQCTFKEVGLGALALINYSCGAEALGVVSGCFVKNKLVANSTLTTAIFKDVAPEEPVALLARNNGVISTTLTTEIPESEGGGEHACTEPAQSQVIAVRWCNVSLVDTTNNIVGTAEGGLFAQLVRTGTTVIDVPTCAELLAAPATP